MLRSRARSKKAKPSPPLCEITDTCPLPSGSPASAGPRSLHDRTECRTKAAAILEKPSVLGRSPPCRICARLSGSPPACARRIRPALRQNRKEHDGGLDPGAAAALQLVRNELGRDDQNGEVGRFGQIGDASVGLAALHFRGAAADRIGCRERMAQHLRRMRRAVHATLRMRRRRPPFSAKAVLKYPGTPCPPFTVSLARAR